MYAANLETFIAVADAGSFTKAAEKLYISSTAVIKQINTLEGYLDVSLFERLHRGLLLTEAGKVYYRDAKYMIQYAKEAKERARNAMKAKGNVLRVGVSPITPPHIVEELWCKMQEEASDIRLRFVPFENTKENAREILAHLGENIDIVCGIFDNVFLEKYICDGLELCKKPIGIAVSSHHSLAKKKELSIEDLYGKDLMLMQYGEMNVTDILRDDLRKNHPQIHIMDFDFYNIETFNQCENGKCLIMAIDGWQNVHPLLKVIPVNWRYEVPYGILHSPEPTKIVKKCLAVASKLTFCL